MLYVAKGGRTPIPMTRSIGPNPREMASSERDDLHQRIHEVLSAMPPQEVRDGGSVLWGPDGNKARAVYLAARFGHVFKPTCRSCESDLWLTLKLIVK